MNTSFFKTAARRVAMLVALSWLGCAALPAHAVDVAGSPAAGSLYSAALYVDGQPASGEAATAGNAPRQLRVTMLRSVNAGEIAAVLAQGLAATASDEELLQLVPALFGMGEMLGEQKTLAAGEGFQLDWAATTGTTISIQSNQPVNTLPQAASQSFAQSGLFGVMSRSWLGQRAGGVKGS